MVHALFLRFSAQVQAAFTCSSTIGEAWGGLYLHTEGVGGPTASRAALRCACRRIRSAHFPPRIGSTRSSTVLACRDPQSAGALAQSSTNGKEQGPAGTRSNPREGGWVKNFSDLLGRRAAVNDQSRTAQPASLSISLRCKASAPVQLLPIEVIVSTWPSLLRHDARSNLHDSLCILFWIFLQPSACSSVSSHVRVTRGLPKAANGGAGQTVCNSVPLDLL